MKPHLLVPLLLALSLPALGQETVDDLRRELEDRVARNNWAAADRAFESLASEGKPTARDYVLGGRAARALGRVNDAASRFERALKADKAEQEAHTQLGAIAERYGEVKLKAPGWQGGVPLRPAQAVIDSELRMVIEHARKTLESEGKYAGLLPLGGFTLGDQAFEVSSEGKAKATLR